MIPNPANAAAPQPPLKDSLTQIKTAKEVIETLLKGWTGVERTVEDNRKLRRVRIDVEANRNSGKLKSGDIYVGVRLIDNNIRKDIPPFIAYLKSSPRMAIMTPEDATAPAGVAEQVEKEFSRVLRYPMWEFDYIRALDGAELHGFDWLEVLYDTKKPGQCAINHVGIANLIFDLGVENIQDSRMVLRRYSVTLVSLADFARENGFDEAVTKKITEKLRERKIEAGDGATNEPPPMWIFKVFFKEDGIVQTAWWCREIDPEKWLREPRKFWNGVKTQQTAMVKNVMGLPEPTKKLVEAEETEYPFEPLYYRITEDPKLSQAQGRAEMDLYKQEAACTIWSTFVNANIRSGKTMWSPREKNIETAGVSPKQTDIIIKDGAIWDQPMDAFHSPAPDPMLPKALDMLMTQNADDLDKAAYTVQNRKDSRKTATEVAAAQQDDSQTEGVSVLMFSVTLRNVLVRAWRIVLSQIRAGIVKFSLTNPQALEYEYIVKAAGDVDYIERQQAVQNMQQDWPVFQSTPLAGTFLEEYIRVRYPSRADAFIQALRAGDQAKVLVQSLAQLLQAAVMDPTGKQLDPEWQPHSAQLAQIAQSAQAFLGGPSASPAAAAQKPTTPAGAGQNTQ